MIDETIKYFRANVFFRNFEVKGGGDRTMIYLTLYLAAVSVATNSAACELAQNHPTTAAVATVTTRASTRRPRLLAHHLMIRGSA